MKKLPDIKEWKNSKKYIYDPEFFDKTIKKLDKEVVGEISAREVLLLCTSGRLVENANATSYHLCVNDESGAGKDHLCKSIGKLYEPESVFIKRTRISPKVLNYWHAKDEDWTWNNKVLYLEDVSYEVLNNEVMRTFLSSGTHATILADQSVRELEVPGKPIVLFTTATVNPKVEMLRRLNILNLDTSINQTKEIAKRKCKLAKDGVIEEIDPSVILAISRLKRVKVKIPHAGMMARWIDEIPDENVRVLFRTQIETFLDYIKAATAIYQYQREQDDKGYFLSTEQDYEIARRCFMKMVSNPLMIPLTKQQQKVMEIVKGMGTGWQKMPEVIEKITFWEQRWAYKQLNKMVDAGIFERSKEKIADVDKPITIIKLRELAELKLPSYDELLQK